MGKLLDDYNAYMLLQDRIKYTRVVLEPGIVEHRPKRRKHKKSKPVTESLTARGAKALDRDFKRRIERER